MAATSVGTASVRTDPAGPDPGAPAAGLAITDRPAALGTADPARPRRRGRRGQRLADGLEHRDLLRRCRPQHVRELARLRLRGLRPGGDRPSVDKLPGALWVQALSVRLLGVHPGALALPQVVEGAVTVLILYRVVRRLSGVGAATVAAAPLAVSPGRGHPRPGQHLRHTAGPPAGPGGGRPGGIGGDREPAWGAPHRTVGGAGLPGEDGRGVAGGPRPGRHLPRRRRECCGSDCSGWGPWWP